MATLRRRARAFFSQIEIEFHALFVVEFVEVAEAVAAQGGRSAVGAVDLEMLAPIWEIWHGGLLPPPPRARVTCVALVHERICSPS
jgi:hypothetical protein